MEYTNERLKGKVLWYREVGWGFVKSETGAEFFFHHTELALKYFPLAGDTVNFSVKPGRDNRPQAVDIKPITKTEYYAK